MTMIVTVALLPPHVFMDYSNKLMNFGWTCFLVSYYESVLIIDV